LRVKASPQGGIAQLTELAYAAALDETLWSEWVQLMLRQFEATGAVFGVIDGNTGAMRHWLFLYDGDRDLASAEPEYAGEMAAHDPVARRIAGAERPEIFDERAAFDLVRPSDATYMRWQTARLGIRHNLTAAVALESGSRAGIALNWSPSRGPAGRVAREQMRMLLPHFTRSLALGFRHAAMLQSAWWEGLQADNESAAILLDPRGQILRLSPAAAAILARGDGLTARANRLVASDPDGDAKLQHTINRATGAEPSAGSASVRRAGGRRPYLLTLYPLAAQRRFLAPEHAAALLRIADPLRPPPRLTGTQRELLGLSRREAAVADLLLEGHSLESLAARLDIARNTARNHLQALFRKTCTNRQTDLLRLLMMLQQGEPASGTAGN